MNIMDAINNVDKDVPEYNESADIQYFWEELVCSYGYLNWSKAAERIKEYPLQTWLCTDTEVGLFVYYVDGEPVCTYFKQYRKSDPEIEWLSKKAVTKMIRCLKDCTETEEPEIKILDPESEISDTYKVSCYEQTLFMKKRALYRGEPVTIIGSAEAKERYAPFCIIEHNGEEKRVNVSDIDFPTRINND